MRHLRHLSRTNAGKRRSKQVLEGGCASPSASPGASPIAECVTSARPPADLSHRSCTDAASAPPAAVQGRTLAARQAASSWASSAASKVEARSVAEGGDGVRAGGDVEGADHQHALEAVKAVAVRAAVASSRRQHARAQQDIPGMAGTRPPGQASRRCCAPRITTRGTATGQPFAAPGSVEIRSGRPVLVRCNLRTSTPRRRSAGAARTRRLERTAGVRGQSLSGPAGAWRSSRS